MRKNKPKEKSFTQGPIMLGITIGLGVFVCTAAVMIGASYLGLLSNDSEIPLQFTPKFDCNSNGCYVEEIKFDCNINGCYAEGERLYSKENTPIKITIEDGIGVSDKIAMP